MSKKRIVFDVGILLQGVIGDGSGIFYTALNLFEQFAKNKNIDLVLYSSHGHVHSVQRYLQKRFQQKFEAIGGDNLEDILFELKLKRRNYKKKHQYIRRLLFDVFSIFIKIVRKLRDVFSPLVEPIVDGDVYFSPNYAIPSNIKIEKKYLVLYDAIPLILPEYFNEKIKTWFADVKESIDKNTHCFAISESAKNDFLKYWSDILTDNKITVVPLAAADTFYPVNETKKIDEVRKRYHIPAKKKICFQFMYFRTAQKFNTRRENVY